MSTIREAHTPEDAGFKMAEHINDIEDALEVYEKMAATAKEKGDDENYQNIIVIIEDIRTLLKSFEDRGINHDDPVVLPVKQNEDT